MTELFEKDLENIAGGATTPKSGWEYADGEFVNYGNYIVYTIATGDALSGIAIRFGVTVEQICQWNNIKNPNMIIAGQKLTIYAPTAR